MRKTLAIKKEKKKSKERYRNVTSQEGQKTYLMPSYTHRLCEPSHNRGKEWSTEDWVRLS